MSKNRGNVIVSTNPNTGTQTVYQKQSKFQKALANAKFMAYDVRAKNKDGKELTKEQRAYHRGRYESMCRQAKSYDKNAKYNGENNNIDKR